jgi:hypothetical protein
MTTLTAVLAVLIPIILAALPLLKKYFDKLGISVTEKQVGLLKKVIEDSVDHVNQVSMNKDMESVEKKELAIKIATNMADKLGIPKKHHELAGDLIESILWKQEDSEIENEEDGY